MAINPTTPLTPFVYGPTEHDTIKCCAWICLPWYELGGVVCSWWSREIPHWKSATSFCKSVVSCVQPLQSPKSVEGCDVCCVCVGNAFVRPLDTKLNKTAREAPWGIQSRMCTTARSSPDEGRRGGNSTFWNQNHRTSANEFCLGFTTPLISEAQAQEAQLSEVQ